MMDSAIRERLFGADHAFDSPVTVAITAVIVGGLVLAPIIIWLLVRFGKVGDAQRRELFTRYYSWLVIVPVLMLPILAGAAWTMLGVGMLSLFCFREFARATGLIQYKTVFTIIVLGILLQTFTALDNWYNFFVALTPLTIGLVMCVAIFRDQPQGYIQRAGLGVLGFTLFGTCLGHLEHFANDANYRPYLLLIFLSVELNDVFAYISGKTLGRRKLAPNTSPNKTLGGAVGAMVLTTLLVAGVGHFVFNGTTLAGVNHLITMGILISLAGQFGDLMLSSIKRDLGVKDMGVAIPGHGGFLDRFDSIILVAPMMYHYINYFEGLAVGQTARIITGGG